MNLKHVIVAKNKKNIKKKTQGKKMTLLSYNSKDKMRKTENKFNNNNNNFIY